MLYAEDFRSIARNALSGKWGVAVGTGFIASLFGISYNSGDTFNFRSDSHSSRGDLINISLDFNKEDLINVNFSSNNDFVLLLEPYLIGLVSIISILFIMSFIFGGAIELGYCRFNMNLINGTNPQFHNLFSKFHIFWKAFGMNLLRYIYVVLWSLLFVIPGIIAAISYAMTPFILEEHPNMGINEAIGESKNLMRGNKWRYFCLMFSFIGWAILCAFTFGIGFLWLNPYVAAANAAFYREISGKNESDHTYEGFYGSTEDEYYR
jgi:uncharacterized membrane protein